MYVCKPDSHLRLDRDVYSYDNPRVLHNTKANFKSQLCSMQKNHIPMYSRLPTNPNPALLIPTFNMYILTKFMINFVSFLALLWVL